MKFITSLFLILYLPIIICGQPAEVNLEIDSLNWEIVPFPEVAKGAHIFAEHNGRLWVSDGELYFSDDEGVTWEKKPEFNNVINIFEGDFGLVVVGRYTVPSTLYSSDYLSFSISQDNGDTFFPGERLIASSASMHGGISLLELSQASDSLLLYHALVAGNLGCYYVIRSSRNGGVSWEEQQAMIGSPFSGYRAFHIHQDKLLALKLLPNSQFWELTINSFQADTTSAITAYFQLPTGYDFNPSNYRFFVRNGKMFILFSDGKMICGNYLENDWISLDYPFSDLGVQGISFAEDVFQVNTPGQLWEVRLNDLSHASLVFESEVEGRLSFKKTENFNFVSDPYGIYLKEETASTYTFSGEGINYEVSEVKNAGEVIWGKFGEWFRSVDYGENWSRANDTPLNDGTILSDFENIFYLQNDTLLYRSLDNGLSWDTVNILLGENIFLETADELFVYNDEFLFSSTDGINFEEKNHPGVGKGTLVLHGNKYFYFTADNRYRSVDNGNTWIAAGSAEDNPDGNYFSIGEVLVHLGAQNTVLPVRTSIDEGFSWIDQSYLYPIITPYVDFVPIFVSKVDNLLFMNGRNFTVTQDNGQTLASLNNPFFQIVTRFNDRRPGPAYFFEAGDHIYGFSEETNFYRTSLEAIKNQLPSTFDLADPHISWRLFKDLNNSCTFDSTDVPLANKVVRFRNDFFRTDEHGYYKYYINRNDGGSYITATVRNTEMICANLNQGYFSLSNIRDTLDIAFHPIPNVTDGGVNIYSSDIFRADQTATIKIKVSNLGSLPIENQVLNFTFDENHQSILQANEGFLLNDTLWQFPVTLEPHKEKIFSIELLLDESLTADTTLNYTARLVLPEDIYPTDNLVDFFPATQLMELPNEKAVHPDTVFATQESVDLIYRIRFQNTGADTAFQVTIIDTLSTDLSTYSFEMLEASHPYRIELDGRNRQAITWIFEDINLPNRNTNDEASKGHLIFKLTTDDELVVDQEIFNDATVYFDMEEPVMTNEAVTIVKKPTIIYQDSIDVCYGDLFNNSVVIEDSLFIVTVSTPDYDSIYQTFVTARPTYQLDTLIFAAPGDLIEGTAVYSDTIIRHELLNIHNCDSISVFFIKITTTGIAEIDRSSFNVSIHPNPNNGTAKLTVNLNTPTTLSATWFTATGQRLRTALPHRAMAAGRHEVPLDFTDMPAGIHFLKIKTLIATKWLKIVKE